MIDVQKIQMSKDMSPRQLFSEHRKLYSILNCSDYCLLKQCHPKLPIDQQNIENILFKSVLNLSINMNIGFHRV